MRRGSSGVAGLRVGAAVVDVVGLEVVVVFLGGSVKGTLGVVVGLGLAVVAVEDLCLGGSVKGILGLPLLGFLVVTGFRVIVVLFVVVVVVVVVVLIDLGLAVVVDFSGALMGMSAGAKARSRSTSTSFSLSGMLRRRGMSG